MSACNKAECANCAKAKLVGYLPLRNGQKRRYAYCGPHRLAEMVAQWEYDRYVSMPVRQQKIKSW